MTDQETNTRFWVNMIVAGTILAAAIAFLTVVLARWFEYR